MRKPEEKRFLNPGTVTAHMPDNSRHISAWPERGGVVEEKKFNKLVTSDKRIWKWSEKEGMSERRRREMPSDRRSSGKQKRLHTLLRLICPRVLSTAGSVSVTPFPPSLPVSLLPPHLPPSPAPFLPLPPLHCLLRTPLSGQGWRQGARWCWGAGDGGW